MPTKDRKIWLGEVWGYVNETQTFEAMKRRGLRVANVSTDTNVIGNYNCSLFRKLSAQKMATMMLSYHC